MAVDNANLYSELADFAKELERSQAQLVQAEKMAAIGRLAASIAHEINNPLQAIHNSLHLSLHERLGEDRRFQYLSMAQAEVQRVSVLAFCNRPVGARLYLGAAPGRQAHHSAQALSIADLTEQLQLQPVVVVPLIAIQPIFLLVLSFLMNRKLEVFSIPVIIGAVTVVIGGILIV